MKKQAEFEEGRIPPSATTLMVGSQWIRIRR